MARSEDEAGGLDVGSIEVLAFLAELVLLAVLAVAGARLGSGALSLVLGVLLPVAAAAVWGLRLAPRARKRLRSPARLVAKLALLVVAAGLLAISGAPGWAVAFLVSSGAVFTAGERRESRAARTPERLPRPR